LDTAGAVLTVSVVEFVAVPPGPVQVNAYVSVPAVAGETVWLPLVAIEPLHEPDASHAVASVDDHVSLALVPAVMVLGPTASETVGNRYTVKAVERVMVPPSPLHAIV